MPAPRSTASRKKTYMHCLFFTKELGRCACLPRHPYLSAADFRFTMRASESVKDTRGERGSVLKARIVASIQKRSVFRARPERRGIGFENPLRASAERCGAES